MAHDIVAASDSRSVSSEFVAFDGFAPCFRRGAAAREVMSIDDRFSIRPPGATEGAELASVLAAMERHYDAAVTDDEAASACARLLGGHAPARCLVAVSLGGVGEAGRFLGIALFAPVFPGARFRDVMFLKELFVRPEARGEGVARALLAGVARATIDAGCERLEWVTDRGNAGARAAYKAMGVAEGDRVTYRVGAQGLVRLAATGHADPRGDRRSMPR